MVIKAGREDIDTDSRCGAVWKGFQIKDMINRSIQRNGK